MILRDLASSNLLRITVFLCLAVATAACGVSFSDSFDGTEVFKGISLGGGACSVQADVWRCPKVDQLTVDLQIADGYPVPLRIACYYEDPDTVTEDQDKLAFHERAMLAGESTVDPKEGRKPGDKHIDRELVSISFPAPPPGDYFLACLTPAAADNGLGLSFKILG
jgi:hypothetical protein